MEFFIRRNNKAGSGCGKYNFTNKVIGVLVNESCLLVAIVTPFQRCLMITCPCIIKFNLFIHAGSGEDDGGNDL